MTAKVVNAVVTGGAGWLGTGLVNALLNGIDGVDNLPILPANATLRVLVRPGENVSLLKQYGKRIQIMEGDIRSLDDCRRLMQGADDAILYHTAGIIHPHKVAEFFDINVSGTRNVLAAAESAGITRAVVVSSNSPIGCNPTRDHVFDEASPFNPYMGYGRSKMEMEKTVLKIQDQGRLETVRIRAPWFYGPFQPPRQSLFFQMIRDGKGPIVGDGGNMRSMAYIDNLAQGLILAGKAAAANGKVYWIADQRPYSMNEIIDTIEAVLEEDFQIPCAHKRMKLPSVVSDIALLADKLVQATGLYHQKIHVLSEMNKTIACSIALANKELGYKPSVELREGIKRSVAWMFRNNQPLK